jgi:hypothetical protein
VIRNFEKNLDQQAFDGKHSTGTAQLAGRPASPYAPFINRVDLKSEKRNPAFSISMAGWWP